MVSAHNYPASQQIIPTHRCTSNIHRVCYCLAVSSVSGPRNYPSNFLTAKSPSISWIRFQTMMHTSVVHCIDSAESMLYVFSLFRCEHEWVLKLASKYHHCYIHMGNIYNVILLLFMSTRTKTFDNRCPTKPEIQACCDSQALTIAIVTPRSTSTLWQKCQVRRSAQTFGHAYPQLALIGTFAVRCQPYSAVRVAPLPAKILCFGRPRSLNPNFYQRQYA